jgi:ubiquinone/menaquinone biosynthesis C-methylase UbiE
MSLKDSVRDFWDMASCGEDLYLSSTIREGYREQAKARYRLEGEMIFPFAHFQDSRGLDVLEIGVGLGADHQQFAQAGALLTGIDLTPRAVAHTQQRLESFGLNSSLKEADAENLPFDDDSYHLVYSWGVLHHSPDTQSAINEVFRVLKLGGGSTNYDLSQVECYRFHAVVALWLGFSSPMAQFK